MSLPRRFRRFYFRFVPPPLTSLLPPPSPSRRCVIVRIYAVEFEGEKVGVSSFSRSLLEVRTRQIVFFFFIVSSSLVLLSWKEGYILSICRATTNGQQRSYVKFRGIVAKRQRGNNWKVQLCKKFFNVSYTFSRKRKVHSKIKVPLIIVRIFFLAKLQQFNMDNYNSSNTHSPYNHVQFKVKIVNIFCRARYGNTK